MRAVVHERYGPPEVLQIKEVAQPVPNADEALVRIHASSVTRSDLGVRDTSEYWFSRFFTGVFRPKRTIAGSEFAGIVESVGEDVTEFRVGDEVFGIKGGSNAEYVCVRESGVIAHKPAGLSFEQAAAVPDGALLALTCFHPQTWSGKQIVVYGASGSMGTATVQLTKHFGAEVTAICSTKDVELVRSLGADEVVDYLHEDFARNGKTYHAILDAVGKHSFRRCRRSLKPGGAYVTADLGYLYHAPVLALVTRFVGSKKVKIGIGSYRKRDLALVNELIEAGAYRPVVDRTYPLEEVVAATRYVETGQKTGSVVLSVNGAGR
ncbi:MAG TPA: NAD(P)-dependent alcohol dehydrogenase [Gaiellaceae bacterium]|nr:NAD(P)-dependent alcohol dehydrogenase [Gaiellaceae bacterium]